MEALSPDSTQKSPFLLRSTSLLLKTAGSGCLVLCPLLRTELVQIVLFNLLVNRVDPDEGTV